MFVEKLTNEEINMLVKKILEFATGKTLANYYFEQGKIKRFEDCVSFYIESDYDEGLCYITDWNIKLSLESKKVYYENSVAYERFMHKKFGQEYIDALTNHLMKPIEHRYQIDKQRIEKYIEGVVGQEELRKNFLND